MSELHFASIWEHIADRQPEAPAIICSELSRSWREYDQRAARIAAYFNRNGLGVDTKIGLYMHNCLDYLEAHFAALKARAVPINVNFRYLEDELVYLLDNADCEALVYHAAFAPRLEAICHRLPKLKHFIRVNDGSGHQISADTNIELLIAQCAPMPRIPRNAADIYMIYTGGTTGLPKGVMYEMGALVRSLNDGGWGMLAGQLPGPSTPAAIAEAAVQRTEAELQTVSMAAGPLMHGTGILAGSMLPHMTGAAVVVIDRPGLDVERMLADIQLHRVTLLVLAGDVFARPLLAALDEAAAAGNPYDLTSLQVVLSAGVMWSKEVKQGLLRHCDMRLVDSVGSSEGSMVSSVTTRDSQPDTARFNPSPSVRVFDDDDIEVTAGSGEIGKIATSANLPLGYYKDPERTARTFRTIDGVRYSFPGDHATVAADGTITLLGRGSGCINTGGEKVYPEEVEEAIKQNPLVADCLVVGVPDALYGHRVVAVVEVSSSAHTLALDAIQSAIIETTRERLAGYKVPKAVYIEPLIQRLPNGKPDYTWARQIATGDAAGPD